METQGPFDDIRKHSQTNNLPKVKVNNVLEAVTDAIRAEKRNHVYEPSYVEYFVAFMTTLKTDNQHITELFYLINELLPYLATNIKRAKCVDTLDFLLNGCSANHDLIDNSAARSLIHILSHMLSEQEINDDVWNNQTIQRSFSVLMNYCIDSNGKIRKCAQEEISHILNQQKEVHTQYAWNLFIPFLCSMLDSITEDTNTSVLQILSFLYSIIEDIPDQYIPKLFECLLQARQHPFSLLDQCCLRPISRLLATTRAFDIPFLTKLHTVLIQYPSSIEQEQPSIQFIECLVRCCEHFYPQLESETTTNAIPKPTCEYPIENDVKLILSYYLCNNTNIHKAIQMNLSDLYIFLKKYTLPSTSYQAILSLYQITFEFKYQHAWISIIKSFTDLISFSIQYNPESFYESLRMLLGIYENSIKGDSKFVDVIFTCFGVALELIGLQHFLTAVPLIEEENSIPSVDRYFLIDILKQHLKHTQSSLAYYYNNVIPIAKTAYTLSQQATDPMSQMHYVQVIEDIWSLFPSLCVACTDIPETFPTIAKSLAGALTETKVTSIPIYVCKGLNVLIKSNQKALNINFDKHTYIKNNYNDDDNDIENDEDENKPNSVPTEKEDIDIDQLPFLEIIRLSRAPKYTEEQAKKNLEILTQFSENYISILFPLYEKAHGTYNDIHHINIEGVGENGNIESIYVIRSCIESFMSISTSENIHEHTITLLKSLLTILSQNNESMKDKSTVSQALIYSGLLSTVLPFAKDDDLSIIYRCIKPQLTQDNFPALQKRVYFCLMYLCKYHSEFLLNEETYKDIFNLLFNTILSVSVNSKKYRLRCIYYLIMSIPPNSSGHLSLIPHILPEIILCTKDTNKKIRDIAFDICIYIGFILKQKQGSIILDDGQQFNVSLSEFYKILIGCMTSTSPHLQSASIQVITRVLFAYKDEEDTQQNIINILHVIYELMKQKNREIIKSCLGFIKTSIKILPDDVVLTEMHDICSALLLWSKDTKNRFRLKVRIIIEGLYKRFGGDVLKQYIPESETSLFSYIQKDMKKKQKGKKDKTIDDDNDDDDNYISDQKDKTKRANNRKHYINDRDTIVDLMDRYNTSQNITTRKERREDMGNGVEVNADGKIVFKMDEIEKKPQNNKKKTDENIDNNEDEEEIQQTSTQHQRKVYGNSKKSNETGERFKAKKAGGDVKRNGVDPYAYIRLDPRTLSKKKRTNNNGGFSSLIGAAKKGARLGKKDAINKRKGRN